MKISHVKTYHCDICGRYCYPADIELDDPLDRPWFSNLPDEVRIYVVYRCACGIREQQVRHEIDGNGELFPHYKLSRGK